MVLYAQVAKTLYANVVRSLYGDLVYDQVRKQTTYYGPVAAVAVIVTIFLSIIVINYFRGTPTENPKTSDECRISSVSQDLTALGSDIADKYIVSDVNNDNCPALLCYKQTDGKYCVEKPGGQRRYICYDNPMEMLITHIRQQSKFDDTCFSSAQILRLFNQITNQQVVEYNISLIKKLADVPNEIKIDFNVKKTDELQALIDKLQKELVPEDLVQEITLFYKFLNINRERSINIIPNNIIKNSDGLTQLDRMTLTLNKLTDYKKDLLNRAIGT